MLLDINECTLQEDNCSPKANCTNQIGSFSCVCLSGYVGNGITCVGMKRRQVKKMQQY